MLKTWNACSGSVGVMRSNVIVVLAWKRVLPVLFMKINKLVSFLLVTSTGNLRQGFTFAHIFCALNVQRKVNVNLKSSILQWPDLSSSVSKIAKNYRQLCHFCPHGTTRLQQGGFCEIFTFQCFSKTCWENSSFINIGQELWVLYMKTNIQGNS